MTAPCATSASSSAPGKSSNSLIDFIVGHLRDSLRATLTSSRIRASDGKGSAREGRLLHLQTAKNVVRPGGQDAAFPTSGWRQELADEAVRAPSLLTRAQLRQQIGRAHV